MSKTIRRLSLILVALFAIACSPPPDKKSGDTIIIADSDSDSDMGASVGLDAGGDADASATASDAMGCVDVDEDGFSAKSPVCPSGDDCDDADPATHPGGAEICGDRLDNNCNGLAEEGCDPSGGCTDEDGDQFGFGDCLGFDCDDTDPAINPDATEVCANDIDENCDGVDPACPVNCIDNDGDGYGAPGSTDCFWQEVDCDDSDRSRNPARQETCDGKDNDCDGETDECALSGQSCNGNGLCAGGVGAQCAYQGHCSDPMTVCEGSGSPKVCLSVEGGACSSTNDCTSGLTCENGTCAGPFCSSNPCGSTRYCDAARSVCVQCPYFEPSTFTRDAPCPGTTVCADGGWCGYLDEIKNTDGNGAMGPAELFWINVWLAACWESGRHQGAKELCSTFDTSLSTMTVTKTNAKAAFTSGDLAAALGVSEVGALNDIWGTVALDKVEFRSDILPGTTREFCLWYDPTGGSLGSDLLIVDRCMNFVP